MSLRPDEHSRRSRSKSPGRARERSRSRSHSHVRAEFGPGQHYSAQEYAPMGTPQYETRQPLGYPTRSANEPVTMGNYADLPPEQRPAYLQQAQAAAQYQQPVYSQQGNIQYTTTPNTGQQFAYTTAPARDAAGSFQYAQAPDKITFSATPVAGAAQQQQQQPAIRHTAQPMSPTYAPPPAQYAAVSHAPAAPPVGHQPPYPPPPMGTHSGYDGRRVVEMVPGGGGGGRSNAPPSPAMRPHSLSVGGGGPGLTQGMDRLSVSGSRPDLHGIVPGGMPGSFPGGGGLPPPSPLLEAYRGVYQSISPMPQAMMLDDDDVDHLQPLDSLSPRESRQSVHGRRRAHSRSGRSPSPLPPSRRKDKLALEAYNSDDRKEERRARVYDAEPDALAIVDALSARTPDVDALIDILPALSHDQMLELRTEYKRHCKVQGRGINMAKHIKLKTSGNLGKIAYVTALGRYEGEGYWANYWYQSNSARRELLIEALMGRQNHEMRAICDSFKDKRYGDSLVKCMDKELKADKFRKAVLMALEGERQEESDVWPVDYRNRDVDTLYKALQAREGGESAILGVVVRRSDAHLRDCLRTYERKYQGSFARDCLRKSNNLVGEVIAHILNGVINRPARDAMLLHHALVDLIEPPAAGARSSRDKTSSKHERQQRYELLVSRLVRLHWDRMHMARVKAEYEDKYGRVVEEDVEEATKGEFRDFCLALCQAAR
ncbi:Annexin [Didymella exigua CBS 183.55]|uniref:Annexin n=1 Tax=Didymella exigua CBS 183.55 TaxID=1150837 RepID=A0A6A5S460_9PLEO|nr:Annexin [Didymella exigua CBS 183.55]KAF1934234.1 Annexin [Didymella exigua CBS 183.55]